MIFLGGNKIFGIGLMSGTSADGIDAALVKITQIPFKVELKAFFAFPYSRKIRTRILNALSPKTQLKEIGELNMEIGEQFAQAVLKLLKKERISPDSIAFIGSHGQTLYHQPPSSVAENQPPFTFQIGEGSVIAQKTTILTVSDFRAADIACGGEGAPLVPYVDWLLFTHPKKGRALLNLGGIANFTYLPPGGKLSEITAGDTGPGNGLLDSLVQKKFKGRISCDVDGRLASKGKVDQKILKELLSHPFIQKKIPKSAEKSWFGKELVHKLLRKKLAIEDLLATAAAFTAESVVLHLLRYASQIDEIYVSGGGVKNLTLMKMLQKKVKETFSHKISVYSLEKLGIPSKAKEALCFAILAYETLSGKPSNVPQVTGAEKCCILGKISLVKELQCRSQISL
jgi:anhydro-N-acetylmuramic acid kinase